MAEGALIVPRLETKRLLLIPFSLEMKRMTLRDKSRLADLIEARVPEAWPGPDLLDALPFFIAQMEQHPADFVWDGLIVHKADRVLIGDIGFKGGPDTAGAIGKYAGSNITFHKGNHESSHKKSWSRRGRTTSRDAAEVWARHEDTAGTPALGPTISTALIS